MSEASKAATILDFLRFSEKLKCQKRDNTLSNGEKESVAAHSWQLAVMFMLIQPHLEHQVDGLRVLKMLLVHDIVEAELGDIPYSTALLHPELKQKKREMERAEIVKIKAMLGDDGGEEIYGLWNEFEERQSLESKVAKAIDCMEANYQAILYGDISYWDEIYHSLAFTKSDPHCAHDQFLQAMNAEIKTRTEVVMRQNGVDVDKIKQEIKAKRQEN